MIELIAAVIAKDKVHIGHALHGVGETLNIDGELLEIVAHLVMNDFNPNS